LSNARITYISALYDLNISIIKLKKSVGIISKNI
jgi:outer membrane protein TolC